MKSWVKILIGLILGVITGLILKEKAEFLQIFGTAFIKLMTMLVVLIIFSSIVVGICHINDPKRLGRIGFRTLGFYVVSTIIAIFIGLVFAYIIKPGEGLSLSTVGIDSVQQSKITLGEFFLNLIPANPFASFSEGNILQVIIFSIFLAISITYTKEKGMPLLKLLESVANTMHTLTHFVMLLAPYGIFALMAATVGKTGLKVIQPLLKFLACNYIACFIQLFLIFGLVIRHIAKMKIIPFFKGMKDAIIMAFTTSSSAATLPVSLECTQKHLGISEDISGFVLSLGSTINMNGGAIGQAVSTVFIAQAYGLELSWVQIVILVLASLFSAIGAAGIPGTGLIMLSFVLHVVGMPLEGIALVAGVDRLREMVSAVVNIMGDAVAALFIAKFEKEIDVKTYNAATWMDSDI